MSGGRRRWIIGLAIVLAAVATALVAAGLSGRGSRSVPAAVTSSAQVSGRIELDPALRDQVPPGATLFVYAYAVDGPRIPLALRRQAAGNLPLEFSLDDGAAVNPAFRLSMAAQVIVGARLGANGPSVAAIPGELFGNSEPVPVGTRGVRIVIDKRVPGGAGP